MDVKDLIGGDTVTIDGVKNSPVKALVILSGGSMKQMQDGKSKLSLLVEFNGKQLQWIPNKTTMKNLVPKLGTESTNWVGKKINLSVGYINGKEGVIGLPE